MTDAQEPRRARELGIVVGSLPTGPHNALTDVPGVRVGHTTVADPPRLHTGVTAIVPDALGPGRRSLPCGLFVGNGFGKLVGATQLAELGAIETPVLLTATLSAFRAADALVTHVLAGPGHEATRTLNPVVGETNDGLLSDVRARPVTEAHVFAALDGATGGPVAEGCVGAGTGTTALGFKGGIGTASRLVEGWTVGVLVQSNFSGTLTVRGVPIPADDAAPVPEGNSCMIVLATDAPLDARQLGRVARRAVFAMARVGSDFAGGSGDYALAFGVPGGAGDTPPPDDAALDPVFRATMDAVEEALLNSLFTATTTVGHRGTAVAVPHERVLRRLREAGAIPR
ncbi:P1 family peptidase [Promicromonospora citrea]|uniref:D-aminopeptidase n=1 Tax=Promicromonospora citrea TaxID=43677 RepID=A0A8H9GG42_9MICO|nr:P1 family peptidase [Promicromonospora citrea]NNH51650.1 S58 family peptidase [Promicromonospora citrea]GGM22672.1 D-aminopeptidase [Promicromonospora citrea]